MLGMGLMNKIIIEFEDLFWNKKNHWINLCSDERGKFPMFLNLHHFNGKN